MRRALRVAGCVVAVVALGCSGDDGAGAGGAGGEAASTTTASTSSSGGKGGGGGEGGSVPTATIEGDVLPFLTEVEGARIAGVTVTVLEHPEMKVVTGDDAHFKFEGLEVGSDVTLLAEHPDYKPTQTNTVKLTADGIDPFPIQVVSNTLFSAVSQLVPLPIEEDTHCVLATTVGRMGSSLYVRLRQGLPGVSVSLSPAISADSGPLYFNEAVVPDPMQPSTSIDGGALYYRVEPGDYVMSATKDDAAFGSVRFQCRAGIFVNAGPPMGLLANVTAPDYGAGASLPADAYTASSDALCEATAKCVNEKAGAVNYPPATIASCKAMFRNAWSFVGLACDGVAGMRDAAKAFYDCRVASCDLTLGDDSACATEETAFRDAESAYGTCLVQKP